jgi:hypothetical protein
MTFVSAPKLVVLFGLLLASPVGADTGKPEFVETVLAVEAQPIQKGQVLYWDQALADRLGVKVPPGRPGIPAFNKAVIEKLGWEIKQKAKTAKPDSKADQKKQRFYIEKDDHGGSGRAGYIEVAPDVWVNAKGVGKTGAQPNSVAGPPSETFTSHADGSATLEEALKETIMARTADGETRRGGSQVLAIIYTGRTITYADGNKVPLATIVRAPLRRYDQRQNDANAELADALAQANTSRLLKGDFVNASNMGAGGEFVDFGCISGTCGYPNVYSSQNEKFLEEGEQYSLPLGNKKVSKLFERKVGENLLMQLGIPESDVRKAFNQGGIDTPQLQRIARDFKSLIKLQPAIKLDFQEVSRDKLEGDVKLHVWFCDLAADYLASPPEKLLQFERIQSQRLFELSGKTSPDTNLRVHVASLIRSIVAGLEPIRGAPPPDRRASYAESVRKVAQFRNRDSLGTVRPWLYSKAGEVARGFEKNPDPEAIQRFIDDTVMDNRTAPVPTSDSWISTRADSHATELFIRGTKGSDGVVRLFNHPELRGAAPDETLNFRLSTDGGKSHRDYSATLVSNSTGDYLKIAVPHGEMPVTHERAILTPFVRDSGGATHWLKPDFDLKGPPLLFNERVGLSPAFTRRSDAMRRDLQRPVRQLPEDFSPDTRAGYLTSQEELDFILQELGDPDPMVRKSGSISAENAQRLRPLVQAVKNDRKLRIAERDLAIQRELVKLNVDPETFLAGKESLFVRGRLLASDALAPAHLRETVIALLEARRRDPAMAVEWDRLANSARTRSSIGQVLRALLDSKVANLRSLAIDGFRHSWKSEASSWLRQRLAIETEPALRNELLYATGETSLKNGTTREATLNRLANWASSYALDEDLKRKAAIREVFTRELDDPDPAHRAAVAEMLGRLASDDVFQPLLRRLEVEESPSVKSELLRSISSLPLKQKHYREKAFDQAILASRHRDALVREGAIAGLKDLLPGLESSPNARQTLLRVLDDSLRDPSETVRSAAINGLQTIGGVAAGDTMIRQLFI